MTTTHLFVELLVIGFGALAWMLLIIAAVFGYDITEFKGSLTSLGALFPILSLGYVLGILTDRVADWSFDWFWGEAQFRKIYLSEEPEGDSESREEDARSRFFEDRRILVVEGRPLWQFIEYGRSRLRICRGWVLNALLVAFAADIYWLFGDRSALPLDAMRLFYLNVALGLFALLCWFAWWQLNGKEYRKIKRQAEWLRAHLERTSTQDLALQGALRLDGINSLNFREGAHDGPQEG